MNGVYPPNHNRFRELSSVPVKNKSNKNKRLRPDDFVPLPEIAVNEQHLPRYLVASAVSTKTNIEVAPLASYNVFQVERGLDFISKDRLEVTEMRSGDLLIKVPNNKVAELYLKSNFIDCIPVKISLHKTLNTVQGRIFSRKIANIPQEELLESLKSQKVVEVRKITKLEGKEIIATGAAILTFDLIYRPETLKLGWERVPVEEYIPNPMKCKNCQKLGHTKKYCRGVEICGECGIPTPHEPCTRKYCVNCQLEAHTSNDPNCPTFWKHKSVNYLRMSRRCTNREAWEIYNDNPTINTLKPIPRKEKNVQTYAQVLNDQPSNDMSTKNSSANKKNHAELQNIEKTDKKNEHTKTTESLSTNTTNSSTVLLNNNNKNSSQNSTPLQTTTTNINFAQNLSQEVNISTHTQFLNTDDTIFSDDNSSGDNFTFGKDIDNDSTDGMIVNDINETLCLDSPPRSHTSNLNNENTPTSQLYNNFPELNVIITPNTFKKTKDNIANGKK